MIMNFILIKMLIYNELTSDIRIIQIITITTKKKYMNANKKTY